MYRSFVLVGLGGSGGKTVRFVKREVQKRLEEMEWDGGIPSAWQFLHIDTPTIPDGNELNDRVAQVDLDEYLGLVGDGLSFKGVTAELDGDPNLRAEMFGWRIDPANLNVPIGLGAGQFRAVGRTIAMVQGKEIRNRLRAVFRRITDPAARAELSEFFAQTHPDEAPVGVPSAPIVIVISSLAGGTGAGLIMNVCDLIRETGECEGVFTMLYTPEVFGAMGGVGDGVFPNSLAAISEILNGYWLHGSNERGAVPERRNADMAKAGAAKAIAGAGPNYPFLIGLQNANGNSFSNATELFGAVGSGLATAMTDYGLQGSLFAYEIANWQMLAQEQTSATGTDVLVSGDPAGDFRKQGIGAFQGLGTSRLSVGLDFFEDYVAQRIAKDAARYLSLAHVHSDEAKLVAEQHNSNDPDEIAGHIADNQLDHFLLLAGLSELGPDRDQIKDALRPKQAVRDSLMSDARSTAYELGEIRTGGTTNEAVWGERLTYGVQFAANTYSIAYRDALKDNVHQWVEEHPRRVLATIEDFISRHGLVVTGAVLKRAIRYLVGEHGVVEELKGTTELVQFLSWSSDSAVGQGVVAPVQGLGSKVDNSHAALVDGVEQGLHLMSFVGEAHVCEVVAAVTESFATMFLRPLAAAVDREARLLDSELRGPVANWAEWADGLPPLELQPPLSEVTLIEPDAFAATFHALVAETYKDDREPEYRRIRLREEVISGSFLRDDESGEAAGSAAISVPISWSPGTSIDPDETRPQSEAMFRLALTPEELRERARAWMRQPNCPFDKLLSSSLRSYLGDDPVFHGQVDPETLRQRQQRFHAKLRQMLDVAEPLIGIDPILRGMVNPNLDVRTSLSGLPFLNHELESSVSSFIAAELGDSAVAEVLDDDTSTTHITALKRFNGAVSPLIISSLFRPISENWAASSGHVAQSHFWSRRRARVLNEFIPAPQEIIAAMCRGWFVGVALGVIDRKTNAPIMIGRPNDQPVAFPYPTLSHTGSLRDQLAVVLEALSLAYVLVNQEQDLEPLKAYQRLRDLGADASGETGMLYNYEVETVDPRLGQDLEVWLKTGSAPDQIVDPLAQGSNELERLDSFTDVLQRAQEAYRDELERLESEWAKDRSGLGGRPWWPGLSDHIFKALEELKLAATAVREARKAQNDERGSM